VNVKNTSGQIVLENETIVCSTPAETHWRLPIAEVRVIGEFTNQSGPSLDDYFFVFVTKETTDWHCASFYAEGREKFLHELGVKLGHKLKCGLCNSTDFKSRVLWPPNLEGQPLFEFVPEKPATNFLGKVRQKILPMTFNQLTEEIRNAVGN
jgi:hypothetical protein